MKLKPSSNELWNLKQIDAPPLVTFDYTISEYNNLFSETTFHLLFQNELAKLIDIFDNSKRLFHNEKNLLDKIIYKNWNPLRKEKSLNYMKLVKRLLNSFLALKLDELLINVKETSNIRDQSNLGVSKKIIKTLASRETFEYLTIRLLGAFKLLEYGVNLIKTNILTSLMKSIKNGIYLPNNILFMSNLSRLYCFMKKYKQQISLVYNNLVDHLTRFKSTQIQWSKNFDLKSLPSKLTISEDSTNWANANCHINILKSDELRNFNGASVKILEMEDFGEKIDRDEFMKQMNQISSNDESNEHTLFNSSSKKLVKIILKHVRINFVKKLNVKLFKKKLLKNLKKILVTNKETNLNEYLTILLNRKEKRAKFEKKLIKKLNETHLDAKSMKRVLKIFYINLNKLNL